jgi:XTP/dITP diphosphohydrolase
VPAPVKLYLASSNPGKLDEFRALADWARHSAPGAVPSSGLPPDRGEAGNALESGRTHQRSSVSTGSVPSVEFSAPEIEFALVPGFAAMPEFDETAPTFAENALGKALHYSQLWAEQSGGLGENAFVFADDSGLVVPALGGAPGVKSARYAGPTATSIQRNAKLLTELRGKTGDDRAAYFVCVIALVGRRGADAVISARADGSILEAPTGTGGFGYDPVFYFTELQKSFAELTREEKNQHSHRGKAFRRLLNLIPQLNGKI